MKKQWITFDLDGTLMQNPFVDYVFPEIERLVLEKDETNSDVLTGILSEHTARISAKRWVEAYDWDDIVTVSIAKYKMVHSIDVEKIVGQFCFEPAIYLLEENVIGVLQMLKEWGYSLAAVTNGYMKYQKPVLDALRLTPLFDQIITPSESGYAKPDHRMFSKLEGEIVYHVGDRLDHDVQSAHDAGIASIFICRSLPESMRSLSVEEWRNTDEMERFLLAKLNRETKLGYEKLPAWAIPDSIISSIIEMVSIVDEEMKFILQKD